MEVLFEYSSMIDSVFGLFYKLYATFARKKPILIFEYMYVLPCIQHQNHDASNKSIGLHSINKSIQNE